MDFERAVRILKSLLARKCPTKLNSSWIMKHAPQYYRFIRTKIRAEAGGVDWDRVTYALDRNINGAGPRSHDRGSNPFIETRKKLISF